MTREEFSNEIKNYIGDFYGEFLKFKDELNKILLIFDGICQRNNIPYILAYGTLLGAIRDNGTIPWDPDCDVCVPIQHIPQLIQALQSELPEDYFFDSNFKNNEFSFFQMRIGKKGFLLDYFHVDIFYMLGAPEGKKLEKLKCKIKKLYYQRFYAKQCKKPCLPNENRYKYLLKKIYYKMKSLFVFSGILNSRFISLTKIYDYDTSPNCVCFNGEACVSFKHEIIEPIKRIYVDNNSLCVPNKCEEYLNVCYKNYKEYLPIENRFCEFYNWLRDYRLLNNQVQHCDYRN